VPARYEEVKLLGWAPDIPPTTKGIFTDTNQIIPTSRGFTAAPTIGNAGGSSDTIAGAKTYGTAYLKKVNGTPIALVGTATKIYQLSGIISPFTHVDRSGAAYTASEAATWSFCEFGDITMAVNKTSNILFATLPAAFAVVAGAPKASIIINAGPPDTPFIIAFNYDDGTDTPDGIYWSGYSNYAMWTRTLANGSGSVRMLEPTGPIVAAVPYRDGAIAFKQDGMYRGRYVGGDAIWEWVRIAADIGCCGKNMCCVVNDVVYFADRRGFWKYDGSYPVPLPGFVHDYWATIVRNGLVSDTCQMKWDPARHNLWASYVGSQNNFDAREWIVWNQLSGLWTITHNIYRLEGSPGNNIYAREIITFDPNMIIANSKYTNATPTVLVGFSADVGKYDDPAFGYFADAYATLWDIGDSVNFTVISRVVPVWLKNDFSSAAGGAGFINCITKAAPGDVGTTIPNAFVPKSNVSAYSYDGQISNNFLRLKFFLNGIFEFGVIGLMTDSGGTRGK